MPVRLKLLFNLNINSSAAKKFTFTVSHEFEDTVVAPTYSEDGYTLHTCVHCGYSYKDNYVDRYKTQLVGKVYYQTRSSELKSDLLPKLMNRILLMQKTVNIL